MRQTLTVMALEIETLMAERGFERRGAAFARSYRDVRQSFWLQDRRGRGGIRPKFTANLQVAIEGLGSVFQARTVGPLKVFHWQARLLDVASEMEDDWLDLELTSGVVDGFRSMVRRHVLPKFETVDGGWIVAQWRANLGTGLSLVEERRALSQAQEAGF